MSDQMTTDHERRAIQEHVRAAQVARLAASFDETHARYQRDHHLPIATVHAVRMAAIAHNLRDLLRPEIDALVAKVQR